MVELIIVMILVGILAVYAVPKFSAALSLGNDQWRDQVQAALRYSQKSAVSHRRLVCVNLTSTKVTLTIASARGAGSCDTNLAGPDGSATFGVSASANVTASMSPVGSPAGTFFFQPDGRTTSDAAGKTTTGRTITISGAGTLTVNGETGYVY